MSHRPDKKSSFYKRNQCANKTRFSTTDNWSDPILRRRSALAESESTSDRDDSDSLPPPEDLLPAPPTSILKHSNCCCSRQSCTPRSRTPRSRTPSTHTPSSRTPSSRTPSSRNHSRNSERDINKEDLERKIEKENELREQLEQKICKNEVEDALAAEQQDSLQNHLNRIGTLLQALSAYTNCLNLLENTTSRLHRLTIGFVKKDLDIVAPSQITIDSNFQPEGSDKSDKLTDVKTILNLTMFESDELNEMLDTHKKKKNDFILASNNFSQFLRSGSRASTTQLKKLEQQYDTIQMRYQNSFMALNQELPKVIDHKVKTISKCLMELIPISDKVFEKETKLNTLFKELKDLFQEKQPHTLNVKTNNSAISYSLLNDEKQMSRRNSIF